MGAGPTDAEEIKKHPFFDSIDWAKVYNKGYAMVKPPLKKIYPQAINSSIFDDTPKSPHTGINTNGQNESSSYMNLDSNVSTGLVKGSDNNIPGWSFVIPAAPDHLIAS